jgi:hypothetical protein
MTGDKSNAAAEGFPGGLRKSSPESFKQMVAVFIFTIPLPKFVRASESIVNAVLHYYTK